MNISENTEQTIIDEFESVAVFEYILEKQAKNFCGDIGNKKLSKDPKDDEFPLIW